MRAKLESQDYLTTVVEQDNNRTGAHVTGAMIGYLKPGDVAAIVASWPSPPSASSR